MFSAMCRRKSTKSSRGHLGANPCGETKYDSSVDLYRFFNRKWMGSGKMGKGFREDVILRIVLHQHAEGFLHGVPFDLTTRYSFNVCPVLVFDKNYTSLDSLTRVE